MYIYFLCFAKIMRTPAESTAGSLPRTVSNLIRQQNLVYRVPAFRMSGSIQHGEYRFTYKV